jgi:glutamate 5-kinase
MMRLDRLNRAKRVVVKVGSNVLTAKSSLNIEAVDSISSQICTLIDSGLEVLLVSSGAMAAGLRKLGMHHRPDEIPMRQAISAVGQSGLMNAWEHAFEDHGKMVAQILLTSEDLNNRNRYLNARNTLHTLLKWKVIPVINENDTIRIEEIKLGDNDNLAAMIALLMDADFLVNLTDIDGLFTKDPRTSGDAKLIPEVATFEKQIERYAGDIPGALGTGGMLSKIRAAKKITAAGVPMIIANGHKKAILTELFEGQCHGTYFVPEKKRLARRKCWIAYTLTPKGEIAVDTGAANALTNNGKSLLPSGIIDVTGKFGKGDCVAFCIDGGKPLGLGLVNYSSEDIRRIMGLRTSQIIEKLGSKPYDEVIHRDNLVITLT